MRKSEKGAAFRSHRKDAVRTAQEADRGAANDARRGRAADPPAPAKSPPRTVLSRRSGALPAALALHSADFAPPPEPPADPSAGGGDFVWLRLRFAGLSRSRPDPAAVDEALDVLRVWLGKSAAAPRALSAVAVVIAVECLEMAWDARDDAAARFGADAAAAGAVRALLAGVAPDAAVALVEGCASQYADEGRAPRLLGLLGAVIGAARADGVPPRLALALLELALRQSRSARSAAVVEALMLALHGLWSLLPEIAAPFVAPTFEGWFAWYLSTKKYHRYTDLIQRAVASFADYWVEDAAARNALMRGHLAGLAREGAQMYQHADIFTALARCAVLARVLPPELDLFTARIIELQRACCDGLWFKRALVFYVTTWKAAADVPALVVPLAERIVDGCAALVSIGGLPVLFHDCLFLLRDVLLSRAFLDADVTLRRSVAVRLLRSALGTGGRPPPCTCAAGGCNSSDWARLFAEVIPVGDADMDALVMQEGSAALCLELEPGECGPLSDRFAALLEHVSLIALRSQGSVEPLRRFLPLAIADFLARQSRWQPGSGMLILSLTQLALESNISSEGQLGQLAVRLVQRCLVQQGAAGAASRTKSLLKWCKDLFLARSPLCSHFDVRQITRGLHTASLSDEPQIAEAARAATVALLELAISPDYSLLRLSRGALYDCCHALSRGVYSSAPDRAAALAGLAIGLYLDVLQPSAVVFGASSAGIVDDEVRAALSSPLTLSSSSSGAALLDLLESFVKRALSQQQLLQQHQHDPMALRFARLLKPDTALPGIFYGCGGRALRNMVESALATPQIFAASLGSHVARLLVQSRLRSRHGSALETFTLIESLILELNLRMCSGTGRKNALSTAARMMLLFCESLDRELAGSMTPSLSVSPELALFYSSNQDVCNDWLSRLRRSLVPLALYSGEHACHIYFGQQRLMDLECLLLGARGLEDQLAQSLERLAWDIAGTFADLGLADDLLSLQAFVQRIRSVLTERHGIVPAALLQARNCTDALITAAWLRACGRYEQALEKLSVWHDQPGRSTLERLAVLREMSMCGQALGNLKAAAVRLGQWDAEQRNVPWSVRPPNERAEIEALRIMIAVRMAQQPALLNAELDDTLDPYDLVQSRVSAAHHVVLQLFNSPSSSPLLRSPRGASENLRMYPAVQQLNPSAGLLLLRYSRIARKTHNVVAGTAALASLARVDRAGPLSQDVAIESARLLQLQGDTAGAEALVTQLGRGPEPSFQLAKLQCRSAPPAEVAMQLAADACAADAGHFRAQWMVAGWLRRQAAADSEGHAAGAAFISGLPEAVRGARALQLRPADCQEDDRVLEAAVQESGDFADEVRAAVLGLWRIQTAAKMCAVRALVRFLVAAGQVAAEGLHGRHTGGSTQVIACVWVLEALSEFGLVYSDEFESLLASVPLQPWAGIVGQLFSRLGESNRHVTRCLTVLLSRLAGEYPQLVVYPYVVKSGCVDGAVRSDDLVGDMLEGRFRELFKSSCSLVGDFLAVASTPRERWWLALVQWCARVSRQSGDDEMRWQVYASVASEVQSLLDSVGFPLRGEDGGSALLAALRGVNANTEIAVRKQLNRLRTAVSSEPGPVAVAELCDGRKLFAGSSAAPMPGRSVYAPVASEPVVTVASWAPQVTVLASKTRPKKIELVGSDGRPYRFLLKTSEDLRLDARVMEWLRACNRMFSGRRDTRALEFRAYAYAVLPLAERVGLIEWVEDALPLFSVMASNDRPLEAYHTELGLRGGDDAPGRRRRASPEDLRAVYDTLKRAQPDDVLVRYLWSVSGTSTEWLAKLATYRSTLAVMSMVGHVLGLGDRHLDNILFRPRTGEVVHIDFNVCFDKGRRLLVPELVPFRLTRNLERALGPSRSAGAFHRCCERALEVLRENRSALVTLLSAFLYSPLSDWRVAAAERAASSMRPVRNAAAVEAVQGVRAKLADDRPVERQVSALIDQATSDANLSQMFEGWMAWV